LLHFHDDVDNNVRNPNPVFGMAFYGHVCIYHMPERAIFDKVAIQEVLIVPFHCAVVKVWILSAVRLAAIVDDAILPVLLPGDMGIPISTVQKLFVMLGMFRFLQRHYIGRVLFRLQSEHRSFVVHSTSLMHRPAVNVEADNSHHSTNWLFDCLYVGHDLVLLKLILHSLQSANSIGLDRATRFGPNPAQDLALVLGSLVLLDLALQVAHLPQLMQFGRKRPSLVNVALFSHIHQLFKVGIPTGLGQHDFLRCIGLEDFLG
jgi:hypothetical protein